MVALCRIYVCMQYVIEKLQHEHNLQKSEDEEPLLKRHLEDQSF